MSLMYDLLDSYLEEYQREKPAEQCELLEKALDRLSDASDEMELSLSLKLMREAVEMSRQLNDPRIEMVFDFFLANELIGTAQQMDEGLRVVRPAALSSRAAEYDDLPHRIGLNNMLASAYSLIDPAGYGDEIRTIVKMIAEHPLADAEDRCISLGTRYEVEIAEGDIESAAATRDEVWAEAKELAEPAYYLHAATHDAELAYLRQDWQGMIDAAENCWASIDDLIDEESDHEDCDHDHSHDHEEEPAGEDFYGDFDEDFDEYDELLGEDDSDQVILEASRACGLAKLGRSDEVLESQYGSADSNAPRAYPFYLYWGEFHLASDNAAEAITLIEQGVKEMSGKGQYHREAEILALMIRVLHALGRRDEIEETILSAKSAASHLKDPGPMIARIQAARA